MTTFYKILNDNINKNSNNKIKLLLQQIGTALEICLENIKKDISLFKIEILQNKVNSTLLSAILTNTNLGILSLQYPCYLLLPQ